MLLYLYEKRQNYEYFDKIERFMLIFLINVI